MSSDSTTTIGDFVASLEGLTPTDKVTRLTDMSERVAEKITEHQNKLDSYNAFAKALRELLREAVAEQKQIEREEKAAVRAASRATTSAVTAAAKLLRATSAVRSSSSKKITCEGGACNDSASDAASSDAPAAEGKPSRSRVSAVRSTSSRTVGAGAAAGSESASSASRMYYDELRVDDMKKYLTTVKGMKNLPTTKAPLYDILLENSWTRACVTWTREHRETESTTSTVRRTSSAKRTTSAAAAAAAHDSDSA